MIIFFSSEASSQSLLKTLALNDFKSCSSSGTALSKNIQRILVLSEEQHAQSPWLSTKQRLKTDHPWIYTSDLHF